MTKISQTEEELRRAKEDLEDLETYIESFSSFLPLPICTANPIENIIDVNQAFQNISKFSSVEIIGRPLQQIFPEKKKLESLLKKARKEAVPVDEELFLTTKEAKKIPVKVSVSTRKDPQGRFIGYFLAINNITEIKKAREDLEKKVDERTEELENSRKALMNMLEDVEETRERAEEEKNKTLTIVANLSDGLLVLDKNDKISLVNPQAKKFLKIKDDDISGKTLYQLSETPNLETIIKLLGKNKEGLFRKEISLGKNLTIEVSTQSMTSEKKELGKMIILHDITREKTIERMKTEFVSLAAHQLRTPLSAIKWTLQMLLEGDLGEITQEQKEFIKKTYQSNERMISLINDLLDVTRIEEGRYLYKPALSELENIVQFVINSHKDEAKRKGIKLEFKKPKDKLPRVMMDVEKMRLVVQNLLENAIKYTPQGGEINIFLKDKSKEVEFQIKDSGVGIPVDQQGRIFTKFFRGANVIRMDTEGSGLGIFISKNIVEAHGGRMWFESVEGKGTSFFFSLPIKKEFEEFLKEF